jgi:hypothetical protein
MFRRIRSLFQDQHGTGPATPSVDQRAVLVSHPEAQSSAHPSRAEGGPQMVLQLGFAVGDHRLRSVPGYVHCLVVDMVYITPMETLT